MRRGRGRRGKERASWRAGDREKERESETPVLEPKRDRRTHRQRQNKERDPKNRDRKKTTGQD